MFYKLTSLPRPTFRAYLLLIIALFLLLSAARLNSDIIAAGFSISVLSVFFFLFWLLSVCSNDISKNAKFRLNGNSSDNYYAKDNILIPCLIEKIKIPLLIRAICKLNATQEGMIVATHKLKACPENTFTFQERLSFEHRGYWFTDYLELQLFDAFGLFKSARIRLEAEYEFKILPAPQEAPAWNALSSSIKEDNSFPHETQRKGDYYDFKPYHPSDGAKRIVWKLFAKSGELYSKHPEPSYSPEGKLGIFALARKEDDRLTSQLSQFCSRLEQDSIEVYFSTLSSSKNLTKSADLILETCLDHVWLSEEATLEAIEENIEQLLEVLSTASSKPEILCIAVSEQALTTKKIQQFAEYLRATLGQQGIDTNFLISRADGSLELSQSQKYNNSFIQKLFLKPQNHVAVCDLTLAHKFISNLSNNKSEIQWS
jgi:hypothetical protein